MMNLDLRDIPAVYINLAQDKERNESMKLVLNDCGFKNIIRRANFTLAQGVLDPEHTTCYTLHSYIATST